MNSESETVSAVPVGSTLVPEHLRMTFLPKLFGQQLMLPGESCVYDQMALMSEVYRNQAGGYWDYFQTANGARFMAPSGLGSNNLKLVSQNGSSASLSPGYAGMTVTLFALCFMSERDRLKICMTNYWLLRDHVSYYVSKVNPEVAMSIHRLCN